jgi:methylenetetrahydrofolate reductase (NADPH)
MKVIEHINNAKGTIYSFEILPPLKGKGIQSIYNTLDPLMEYNPAFINVTYHRSEFIYKKTADGLFQKKMISKRPGTAGICAAIMTKYKVDAVPHLICGGFSIDETEDLLLELNFLGIENVLLIRGDKTRSEDVFAPEKDGHAYGIDLVRQAVNMNKGIYLEEDLKNAVPTNFCIGVGGYPEKHYEALNMSTDLKYLKAKVDAGAHYIVTQLFYDNQKYFEFVKGCREHGITVPIVPGLKPLTTRKQISTIPRVFSVSFPEALSNELEKCETDESVSTVGRDWMVQQCRELIKFGVPVLHFYTMSSAAPVQAIMKKLV